MTATGGLGDLVVAVLPDLTVAERGLREGMLLRLIRQDRRG